MGIPTTATKSIPFTRKSLKNQRGNLHYFSKVIHNTSYRIPRFSSLLKISCTCLKIIPVTAILFPQKEVVR